MRAYLDLLKKILEQGYYHEDRTGVGRISLYGEMIRFNLKEGFPLVTTRKVPYKAIIKELLWFIKGSTNVTELNEQDVHIWDAWAVQDEHLNIFFEKYGLNEYPEEVRQELSRLFKQSIGPMYGKMWREAPMDSVCLFNPEVTDDQIASDKLERYKRAYIEQSLLSGEKLDWPTFLKAEYYQSVDQLQQLVYGLKHRPFSSRHVVSAWMPCYVPFEHLSPQENVMMGRGALAPCHTLFQCFVKEDGVGKKHLSLMLTQRSADFPVGSVFNIAQYALLTYMLAHVLGYEVDEFIYSLGDVHIYQNQIEQVKLQLQREPGNSPQLVLNPEVKDLFAFKESDILIKNYYPDSAIKYPVAV